MLTTRPAGAQDNGTIEFPENSTDPVAIFTAADPEDDMPITWLPATATDVSENADLEDADNVDSGDFDISATGVLTFDVGGDADPDVSMSPDFEYSHGGTTDTDGTGTNTYKVVVKASDPAAEGPQDTYHKVVVKVTNVDEDGKVTWTVDPDGVVGTLTVADVNGGDPILQFQAGATLTATVTDGDLTGTPKTVRNVIWRWYRSSTNSPTGGTLIEGATSDTYTVQDKTGSDDVGMYLRAEASYTDGSGPVVTASRVSDYPVQAFRTNNATPTFGPDTSTTRSVNEGMKGMKVGAPVTATDDNSDVLNYTLVNEDDSSTGGAVDNFKIDQKTGQITTNVDLDYDPPTAGADAPPRSFTVKVVATDSAGAATDETDDPNTVPDHMKVTITLKNVNEKPTFIATTGSTTEAASVNLGSGSIAENATDTSLQVATYTATDTDAGDTVLLSLRGDDAGMFQLANDSVADNHTATQILSFRTSPNYEDPKDKDKDNVYEVTVRASDRGNLYAEKFVTVRVTNVDEAPNFMKDSPTSFKHEENDKDAVATFKATDPEGAMITWSVPDMAPIPPPSGFVAADFADQEAFDINANTGVLTFDVGGDTGTPDVSISPDFEAPGDSDTDNTYMVVVAAADTAETGAETGYHKVTVEVTDVAEPGVVTWIVAPSNADNTGNLVVDAVNGGKPILQFQDGAILTAGATDGDATVAGKDVGTGASWQWYKSSSSSSCGTNALSDNGADSNIYTVQAEDNGSYLCAKATYSIGGTGYSAHKVSEYKVGRNLAANNANPTFGDDTSTTRMVYEGSSGMMVGDPVTATDADSASSFGDQLNYILVNEDDSSTGGAVDNFKIDQKTGQITTNVDLDYDPPTAGADAPPRSFTVKVVATDSAGAATDETDDPNTVPDHMKVTITLKNVNEKPTFIAPDAAGLRTAIDTPENRTALTSEANVANVRYTAADLDAGDTAILLLEGPDKEMFRLLSSADGLVLSFTKKPDYENPMDMGKDNRYNVIVRATDGTLHADRMIAVNVTDENEAPDLTRGGLVISGSLSADYAEDRTDAVGTYTATGPDAASARWTRDGADATDFVIEGSGASVMLKFSSSRNFEAPADADTDNVYEVILKATDGTNTDTQAVRVTVTDANDEGMVTLDPTQPSVGTPVTATLADEDIAVPGIVAWVWATADTMDGNYTTVSTENAVTASYTPVDDDAGKYLRATVTYNDGFGTGNTEMAVSASAVSTDAPDERPQAVRDYDADGNLRIDIDELFNAIDDYFDEGVDLSIDDLFEIIDAYFG